MDIDKIQALMPQTIVEARYHLSAKQKDLLDIVFSKVNGDNNKEYEIDLFEYAKIYNKGETNTYRDFKKAVSEFEGKGFKLFDIKYNKEIFYVWFQKITYDNANGKIQVVLNSDLHDIFVKMKNKDLDKTIKQKDKRIYYLIKYPMNFKSVYSKRMYCYLKSFEDTGWRIDSIEDLKIKLECESKYKEFRDFKRRVLEIAKEEINQLSDIKFGYEAKIEKKKATKLIFTIEKNPNNIVATKKVVAKKVKSETDILTQQVKDIVPKIKKLDCVNILKAYDNNIDKIKRAYTYTQKQSETRLIKNVVAYMISLKDSDLDNITLDNSTFNKFEQRKCDFRCVECDKDKDVVCMDCELFQQCNNCELKAVCELK